MKKVVNIILIVTIIFFTSCKGQEKENVNILLNPKINNNLIESTQKNYLINSIDKSAIGKTIEELYKIKQLKAILKNTFEREVVRPYMWDIFVARNDTLLQFYNYKNFIINDMKFKSYYIKIDYEDGDYESILLVNESLDTEYNSMIVYEKLVSEVNHSRITQITGDRIKIIFKTPGQSENLDFQVKDGMFLDYFDSAIIDKKWGDKKILMGNVFFEYELKGNTNNHLKNGDWIEVKYSFEYGKSVIQDGSYVNGLRDGDWNYSPEGPVDVIKKFDNGRFVPKSYR